MMSEPAWVKKAEWIASIVASTETGQTSSPEVVAEVDRTDVT